MPGDPDPQLSAALAAVPAWSGRSIDRIAVLSEGITNRNFRVDLGGESFVVRLAGKDTGLLGIDRTAEYEAARAAADAGVAPELVAFLPEHECLITRFVSGAPISEDDLQREDVLAKVVTSVRGIHEGRDIPSSFPVFRVVEDHARVASERGVRIPDLYHELHQRADRIERVFESSPVPLRPCHNDLLNANFLLDGDRVWIVDYDYAGMGDLYFDLGNLSINNGLSEQAQSTLLRLYFGEITPAREARLALMRIMSDFREGMWGVVQQGLSSLNFDYVAYADKHLERCRRSLADDRFEGWLRDAATGW